MQNNIQGRTSLGLDSVSAHCGLSQVLVSISVAWLQHYHQNWEVMKEVSAVEKKKSLILQEMSDLVEVRRTSTGSSREQVGKWKIHE